MALRPHRGEREVRFDVEGPSVQVGPKMALSVAMTLHELATNAIKYGALSNETGRVLLRWQVQGQGNDEILHVRWEEQGGPRVVAPLQTGFGTRLIKRGLAAELGGNVELTYPPEGVVCTFALPLRGDPAWAEDLRSSA
jgi:two-component sensor histidine kinase